MHSKAGCIFSVARIRRYLRNRNHSRKVRKTDAASPVYLTAVLEYLAVEVLELSGDVARQNKRHLITPRHITLAIRQDDELESLLKHVTIAQGGVMPFIEQVLLPKRSTQSKGNK